MDNNAKPGESIAHWLSNLDEHMGSDPLTYVVMTSLMAWIVRKNTKPEELELFIETILRKLRRQILEEYDSVAGEEVEDLQLPDREAFAVSLDKNIRATEARLRRLLMRNDSELPGRDSAG